MASKSFLAGAGRPLSWRTSHLMAGGAVLLHGSVRPAGVATESADTLVHWAVTGVLRAGCWPRLGHRPESPTGVSDPGLASWPWGRTLVWRQIYGWHLALINMGYNFCLWGHFWNIIFCVTDLARSDAGTVSAGALLEKDFFFLST